MSFYSERRHISRKIRRCFGCWFKSDTNPIQIGDPYWACRGADGAETSGWTLCEACHAHLETPEGQAFLKENIDGYSAGEVLEDRQELAKAQS